MASFIADDVACSLCETVEITADHNFGEPQVQNSKGERRNREEVHCCDGFAVIVQEGLPTPC